MLKAASGVQFPALSSKPAPPRQAAPSTSYSTYASVASGRAAAMANQVTGYLDMVVDPHSKEKGLRYPDETIVPSAMVHLATSSTYTVAEGESTLYTSLRWKCDQSAPGVDIIAPIVQPGPINPAVPAVITDYGGPQATWAALSAVDRTLAAGIRVRLVGLPVSTFLPSGTLYFLQLQANEGAPLTESAAIQGVTAGKGFSVTVNELSKCDGVTIPYLPQGPMSFVFSDTNAAAPVLAGSPYGPAQVVSANGCIVIVGFGLQAGQKLRLDYAHHIEYIPRATAAGLVATAVQAPSSGMRDGISRGAQIVQSSLAGATSLSKVAGLVSESAGGLLRSIGRAAVGMIPGGSLLVGGAAAAARGLGAPAWLTSALDSIA